jgi:hypothetical protein
MESWERERTLKSRRSFEGIAAGKQEDLDSRGICVMDRRIFQIPYSPYAGS